MKHQKQQITKLTVVLMVFAAMLFLQQNVSAQCIVITYDETTGDQLHYPIPCDFPIALFPVTLRGVEQDRGNPPVELTERELEEEGLAIREWANAHRAEYEWISALVSTEDAVYHVAVTPEVYAQMTSDRQSRVLNDSRFVVLQ